MATISSASPISDDRRSSSIILLTVASVLIGFGAMMSFLGAAYLQDVALLAEVPAAFWAFICGQPLGDAMIAPLILITGALSAIVASALLLRPATRLRVAIAGIILLATLVAAGSGYVFGAANRAALQPPQAIAYLTPPRPMPDFALTNYDGKTTRLSDLRGRTVLLFFGYTHCPDICPLALSDMRKVKAALGEDAKNVAFVFVSVDGTRDTPEVLRRYVRIFDPDFIGLTGPENQVRLIALEYGAHFRSNRTGDAMSYTVDHTADTYVLDSQGRWQFAYGMNAPIETVVEEVRKVIRSR